MTGSFTFPAEPENPAKGSNRLAMLERLCKVILIAPFVTAGTMKATESTYYDCFTARGLRPTAPENLNAALRAVLNAMPTVL